MASKTPHARLSIAAHLSARVVTMISLSIILPHIASSVALGHADTTTTAVTPPPYDCMYEWLRSIGLKPSPAEEYHGLFIQEAVSEDILRMSSLEDIKEIGLTKYGHRALVHSALQSGHMCENGGSCNLVMDGEASYHCTCLEGFSGEKCQYVSGCGETVCKNGGSCTLNGGAVQCTCSPGFYGDYCESDICEDSPCLNGGTCSQVAGGYECMCTLGFDGPHCETAWLNKESFQGLVQKVKFIESLQSWIYNTSQHSLNKVQESLASTQGPRFFTKQSKVGPEGAIQTQHFVLNGSDYLGVLINNPSQRQLSGVAIYKYIKGSLSLIQTIPIIGPTSFTYFVIKNESFISVVSSSSSGSHGPNTKSALYKLDVSDEEFRFVREFDAPGARNVEFVFALNTYNFLIFSCGTNGYGRMQDSIVYLWISIRSEFSYYQSLQTNGGERIHSVTTPGGEAFVTFSSQTKSSVFHWNGTFFDLHQQFHSSQDLYPFQIGWHTFLIAVNNYSSISDKQTLSRLYRLDDVSRQFIDHSSLALSGAVTAVYISINSEHFVAFGRQRISSSSMQDTVSIYKMDGTQLVPFQTLTEAGSVQSMTSFVLQNGCSVLTISQETNLFSTSTYTWKTALNDNPCANII